MKGSKPTPIKSVLGKAIQSIIDSKKNTVSEEEIQQVWEQAAGKEASRHSHPIRIKENVLVVNVDSSIWIYQLNLNKQKIEKELNKLLKREQLITITLRAGES